MDLDILYMIANDIKDIEIAEETKRLYRKDEIRKLMIPLTVQYTNEEKDIGIIYVSGLLLYYLDSDLWGNILCNRHNMEKTNPLFIIEKNKEKKEMLYVLFGLLHNIDIKNYINILNYENSVYLLNSLEQFPVYHPIITYQKNKIKAFMLEYISSSLEYTKDPQIFLSIYTFIKNNLYNNQIILNDILKENYSLIFSVDFLPFTYQYLINYQDLSASEYLLYLILQNQDKLNQTSNLDFTIYDISEKLSSKPIIKKSDINSIKLLLRKHLDTAGSTIDLIIDNILIIAYPVQFESLKLKMSTIVNSIDNSDLSIKNPDIGKTEFGTLDDLNFYI